MSWAGRRKGLYITTGSLIAAALMGGIGYLFFYHPATCFDSIKNGAESGIDCGGACTRMCLGDAMAPVVLWTRYFPLTPQTYSVAAYIENPNVHTYVKAAPYTFKLFDADNVLIAERQGVVTIAPTRFVPIIETNINVGNRIPTQAFFEFTDTLAWDKTNAAPRVEIGQQDLDPSGQRLSVSVRNISGASLAEVPVTAILFDRAGTAQAASVSVIPSLDRDELTQVVFTWPQPPARPAIRAEVTALPLYN